MRSVPPLVERRMSLPSLLNLSPVHSHVRSYWSLKVANGPCWREESCTFLQNWHGKKNIWSKSFNVKNKKMNKEMLVRQISIKRLHEINNTGFVSTKQKKQTTCSPGSALWDNQNNHHVSSMFNISQLIISCAFTVSFHCSGKSVCRELLHCNQKFHFTVAG